MIGLVLIFALVAIVILLVEVARLRASLAARNVGPS